MKAILKYIRLGLSVGVAIVFAWASFLVRYSSHPERYPLEVRYAKLRKLSIRVLKGMMMDLHIHGLEKLKEATRDEHGTLIVANHISVLDMLLLIECSPKPIIFVAKKEILKLPFAGRAVKSIDGLFLDREDPRQAIKLFGIAAKHVSNGGLVAIYPEGTRNKDPNNTPVASFHPGSFKIATRGKGNILVAAGFGEHYPLDKTRLDRSTLCNFDFVKMIKEEEVASMKTTELAEICHSACAARVEELKPLDKAYFEERKDRHAAKKWWKDKDFPVDIKNL